MPDSAPEVTKSPPAPSTVAFASFIGTTIEWFDYLVFGATTVLILNPLFFPSEDPLNSTLAGFGAIAVAFIARPLGGLFFGHYGDRLGRKRMLVLSVLLMGIGTFAVGLLPTYHQIGMWAPIMLVVLRFFQGFAVGGEWGGAVLMSLEHAPPHRRAFYASFPQAGVPAGVVLSTGAIAIITEVFSEEDLLAWAWRLPFLASVLLVAVGLWVRLRVTESPEFLALQDKHKLPKVPATDVVKSHKHALIAGMLASLAPNAMFYLASTFFLSYATTTLGVARDTVLVALIVAAAMEVVTLPLFTVLADRWTTRRFLVFASLLVAAGAVPVLLLINTATVTGVFAAYLLALPLLHAVSYGVVAGFTADLFPAEVRYTGSSMAYQFGGLVTSAPVPIIASMLLTSTGSSTSIALYVIAACGLGAIAVGFAPQPPSLPVTPRDETTAVKEGAPS
ncbi:MHS family MFS transporter [Mycobacterium sp. 21AC1]|uniref:MFS transporter n=1 Tax=[Mycobacterium] appelbergii TaxID=2939269 RepID=UPI0029390EEC|nr:MFS transporter [Mycobacterium sp. 21AC1]MDV3126143.1 MHS family MFS transporter [Mycobacterium sp. 21AC1]